MNLLVPDTRISQTSNEVLYQPTEYSILVANFQTNEDDYLSAVLYEIFFSIDAKSFYSELRLAQRGLGQALDYMRL